MVFPNTDGKIEWHANIINRAWIPLQLAAGVSLQVKDANGKLVRDVRRHWEMPVAIAH